MSEPIEAGARVEVALAHLGREHEPPPGWEARVLAAVQSRPHRRCRWHAVAGVAGVAGVAVVAVVAVILALWPGQSPGSPRLVLRLTSSSAMRGAAAHIGDVVDATASGGGRHRAIWVYRDDELVAVCPGTTWCDVADDATHLNLALRAHGMYTVVALTSAAPIPAPHGSYEADLVAADDAGAANRVERIDVR